METRRNKNRPNYKIANESGFNDKIAEEPNEPINGNSSINS